MPSDSRNEEFDQNWDWDKEFENLDWDRELASFTNEILSDAGTEVTGTVPVAAADSAAGPSSNNPIIIMTQDGRENCPYIGCGKTFRCPISLYKHKKQHNPVRLRCPQCDYQTYWKGNLKQHQNRMHDHKPDSLYCQQCDYKTNVKENLRRHQNRMHDHIPDSSHCQQCDYKSPSEG